jgi:hypothetical protein
MDRKKIYTKHKDNPTSFKPGQVPWNKGLIGYGAERIVSNETREKLRLSSSGRKHTDDARKRMSESHKKLVGELNPFYGKKHSQRSKELNKIATENRWKNPEYRKIVLTNRIGKQSKERNPRWKGGITEIHQMIRDCDSYLEWRNYVFSRDGFKCSLCGAIGNIEAHHKISFCSILSDFLKKYKQFSPIDDKNILVRLAISYDPFWDTENGVTLCVECHKTHRRSVSGT